MTTRTREPRCHWTDGAWFTPEHLADCSSAGCRGCRPCAEDHCAMRGSCPNHVDNAAGLVTCPDCIGRFRKDVAAVETLYAIDMPEEAIFAGIDSEAFVLAGAAAAPEQFAARREWNTEVTEAQDWRRGFCDFPRDFEADDRHHPYLVLGRWDNQLRPIYGPNTDLFVTVTSSANFLRGLLAGPFPHTPEFEACAREVAKCRAHLEGVAHDSRTPEQGRHCPRCVEHHGKGPRLRKRYAVGTSPAAKVGDLDTWHCPDEPEHWWSERDYRDRVATDYLQHADELAAAELAERVGVALSTLRKWTARTWNEEAGEWTPARLVSRRKGPDGRKVYPVAKALELAHGRGA